MLASSNNKIEFFPKIPIRAYGPFSDFQGDIFYDNEKWQYCTVARSAALPFAFPSMVKLVLK